MSVAAQTLDARKLSIIENLAKISDEALILKIENLLKPEVDFWDELTDEQKAIVKKAENELNEGKRIPFKDFLEKARQR